METEKSYNDQGKEQQNEAERILGSMPSFEDFREGVEEDMESKDGSFDSSLAEIMEQYEYDENLQNIFKDIAPRIAGYYGDGEAVIEVLKKCPIFMLEPGKNSSEKASSYFNEELDIPSRASGAAVIVPRINDDGNIEVRKGIIVRDGEFDLQTLVHEMCHQIASVNKEPKLEPDGRIRTDVGLSSEFYEKDENGKMRMTETKHEFLEEMINAYDTEMIMKSIKGQEYASNEYGGLRSMLRACPTDVIEKLRQLRSQTDSMKAIGGSNVLEQVSQILDDYMNVSRKIALSKKMSGGDKEKAVEIRRDMDRRSYNQVVEILTSWSVGA